MLRSSLPLARLWGVEVRAHVSLLLLLFLSVGYSAATFSNTTRGLGLWLALFFGVLVREGARVLAALYAGLPLRGILLLPIGGVFALAPSPERAVPRLNRSITFAGPVANLGAGLLLAGIILVLVPEVSLLGQPWISTQHVLRSLVWMQLLLGVVGLLPQSLLPSRNLAGSPDLAPTQRAFGNLGGAVGVLLLLLGFAFMSLWVVVLGSAFVLTAQLRSQRSFADTGTGALPAREAMLRDYVVLSSSDTFQSALSRTSQSLQDTYPVLRGDTLVGSISRSVIARHLRFEGDGYLQGAMNRLLDIAGPEETVGTVLRRASATGAGDLVPVVQDGTVLGILTPQSLARAAQMPQTSGPRAGSTS